MVYLLGGVREESGQAGDCLAEAEGCELCWHMW